ncbi:MAG: hypothetical protein U9Q68_04185 [Euryarchaeota archaeon]|nr:hypothetical protein [Euryarchaeota archaeon]
MKKEVELLKQALEYYNRAIKTKDMDISIELLDKAISFWLQGARQAETEEYRLTSIGNARNAEANKYRVLATKLSSKAVASSGSEQARYMR